MKAIGYVREGASRGSTKRSVGEQQRAFLDFTGQQGYEVAATFLDTEGQPEPDAGFRQMLQYLQREDRGFAVAVIDSLDVLGTDLGEAALKLLTIEGTGVQVLSAETGRDAAKELLSAWNDRAATPLSERVRDAMQRKAVRGEVLGRPPYGYRVGPRHRLELVPEEAVVVRYIFSLYLQENLGVRKIAGQLNAENIPTRRGGRWSMVSVRDLLRNRAYLGTYSRFGVKVPDSHPPLISQQDFRAVQERLTRNPSTGQRTVIPYLLSGLAYCARCGNRMAGVSRRQKWTTRTGEQRTGSYRYYQCESRTNQSACGYNTQRSADLETRVRDLLQHDHGTGVVHLRPAEDADAYLDDLATQATRIEARIRRNRRHVEELLADAAQGHISLERLRTLGAEAAHERQQLEAELAAHRARLAAQESEAERRKLLADARARLIRQWDTLPFEEHQALLRSVVDRIEVDGAEIRLLLRP